MRKPDLYPADMVVDLMALRIIVYRVLLVPVLYAYLSVLRLPLCIFHLRKHTHAFTPSHSAFLLRTSPRSMAVVMPAYTCDYVNECLRLLFTTVEHRKRLTPSQMLNALSRSSLIFDAFTNACVPCPCLMLCFAASEDGSSLVDRPSR